MKKSQKWDGDKSSVPTSSFPVSSTVPPFALVAPPFRESLEPDEHKQIHVRVTITSPLRSGELSPVQDRIMESFYAFLEEFEKELTCSICEEVFTDPVTLPCLHSFCSKCMEQLCEKCNNTNVSCPYPACRSPFDVPDGDVSKLCSSFYLKVLLKLIEIIGTKAKWEGQEMQCTNCERATNLVSICQQCNGLACMECNNAHNILKSSRNHKVTMLSEITRDSVEDLIKNLILCEEQSHENSRLEYFCFEGTCKKYICLKCAVGDHKLHNFSSVDEAAEKVKEDVKQYMKRADDLKQGYGEELLVSQQNISRIRSEVELAKKQVHDAVEAVIQKARDHEEAISKDLDEILSKQQEANDGEQSDINTGINHLSDFNIHCQSLIDRNRKYEVIDVQDLLKDKCEVALQKSTILSSKPIQRNARLHYVSQVPEVENVGKIVEHLPDPSSCTIESLDDVRCGFENQFDIVTKNSEGELCGTNIGSIYAGIKDPDGNEIQAKLSIMKETGRFIARYKAEKVGKCKVVVTIAGEQIRNSPRTVNTIDIKSNFVCARIFSPVNESKEPAFKYPLSIAVNENGEIVIADREIDCIQMFDTQGRFIRKIQVKPNGEQFEPEGVMFFEDKLIVTGKSAGKGEILEIDLTSEQIRTIYRSEDGFSPSGMCVTDENNIAVCYSGNEEHSINSGIKLFDEEGNFLRQFYSPDKNRRPWFVTNGNGKYFVSYDKESCIRVFDNNGDVLYTFGNKGQGSDQSGKFTGLALYGPDLIFVCDLSNHCIQLLTQEGKLVKTFGENFSRMRFPVDLAVRSDGRVFVLNFGTKNIQLWR